MNSNIHETAVVDAGASIGIGTRIWHFSHVMSGAVVGAKCSLGQNVMVAEGVQVGDNVKIQNNVSLYGGVTIEADVFLGPSCVFTNITNPRSQISRRELYEATFVRRGATVGANATIVCGNAIGRYAFVSAGAVVTNDVRDYELVMGVPARHAGWISRHGHVLSFDQDGISTCPESALKYQRLEDPTRIVCLDLDEEAALPAELAVGKKAYREYKQ